MVAPVFSELGSEIFLAENLLNDLVCQQVIQVAEFFQFSAAGIELETINQEIRSNELLILENHPLLDSTNLLLLQAVSKIQNFLYQHYGIQFPDAETCSVLRYHPGQYYKRHVDNLLLNSRQEEAAKGIPIRDVSIVGYLNEDFEGGETFFDRQNLKVKPKAGSLLFFPAYYTYPHQSLPVTKGIKYCFTTWLFH